MPTRAMMASAAATQVPTVLMTSIEEGAESLASVTLIFGPVSIVVPVLSIAECCVDVVVDGVDIILDRPSQLKRSGVNSRPSPSTIPHAYFPLQSLVTRHAVASAVDTTCPIS